MFNKTHRMCRALFFLLGIVILAYLSAESGYCLQVPALKGRVNDYGNILSAATETQLDQYLRQLEQTDSTQIAVLTIPSLQGDSLEGFSLKVAEDWKIGQENLDNGALLLVAVSDRKVRIEVGYGLEGSLTDLRAGRIIKNVILPRFKQGNFDQGIIDGVNAMIQTVKGEYTPPESHSGGGGKDPFGLLVMLIFFSSIIGSLFRKNKIASAVVGGAVVSIFGSLILGFSLPLLIVLLLFGSVFGLISSKLHRVSGRSGRSGYFHTGGFGSSSSGGFGGFSGGGGGFGGGGASGGW
jgi:uncharacterized protein